MRRLLSRPRRWLAGLGAGLVLAAVIALSVLDLPQSVSGLGDTSDNLVRNLVTASVLAILAYLWFYFWTSAWATRDLLRIAQRAPERLFPHSPEIGSAEQVFGRDGLVAEIAAGLRPPFDVGPQIVVGETGAGKTTLLLALAATLARDHSVLPLVLNLRDEDNDLEQHDFSELAVKRFHELIDPYIRTEAEADKLWRWMCRRRRIVVLADDLDRSSAAGSADPYKTWIRLALDAARRRNLPLVLTTRAAGLPPDLSEPPIDLARWPLEADTPAWEYVLRRAGRTKDDRVGKDVEANIANGKLLENAFYLVVLARLVRAGALKPPPSGGKHAVRRALLDAEWERLCSAGVDSAEAKRRKAALGRVERLAAAWLSPRCEPAFEARWLEAIREGERFGLLSLDAQGNPQFRHDVLHAYCASRAITAGDRAWVAALDDTPNAARVQLALVLAAARRESGAFCRRASKKLLGGGKKAVTADQRLLRAAAAAEIARAGGFRGCDGRVAASCVQARPDAGPVAKRAALDQIELLGGAPALEALWDYARDADYDTRWRAVQKLVRRCSGAAELGGEMARAPVGAAAYEVLDPKIEAALAVGRAQVALPEKERPDDWEPEIVTLKQIAWMLPALRTGAVPGQRKKIERHLATLLWLEREGVTPQRGLEASVAQGFKADATLHPGGPPDPQAIEMLRERAVFWYSQLNLVHAVALRMAKDPHSRPWTLARLVRAVARRERRAGRRRPDGSAIGGRLHPMFRFAARLCVRGLRGPAGDGRARRMDRRVWRDESVVVSRRPSTELAPAAVQLVGEIVVLLNLNETGSIEQRHEFGEETTVPRCLGRSRSRDELRSGCPQSCRFNLCPFQPVRDRVSAHREISQAFCRDQRHHARRLRAWRWRSWVGRRALPDFWRWMEGRARF